MIRTFCALLVLACISWPTSADEAKPMTTMLLVARAELPDPNFKDSIVLVMNHLGPAPAGVILNRPTPIPVSHVFPDLEPLSRLDDKVYFGGPVGLQLVSFLFRAEKRPEHAVEVGDGVYFSMDRDVLRELLARDKPMEGLRVFTGYAGWARGQLEAEIARGDWTLAPADAGKLFDSGPLRPWPEKSPGAVQRVAWHPFKSAERLEGSPYRSR
jgi:putative transcriptional regulator